MKDATLKQAGKILEIIGQKETSCEQLQEILTSGLLADLLDANVDGIDRNAFRKFVGLKPLNAYSLIINYDLSVEKAIKAGKYDWVNSDITSDHFPSMETGEKEVSIELIYFGRDMGTDDVLRELDKMSLRPANLKELLALGEKFPDIQREFPIIALGSVWRDRYGYRGCAFLLRGGSMRSLSLDWLLVRWREFCRFAAVRK